MIITCCSKRATPYQKDYGPGRGWEAGYRCKRCRRTRLPQPWLPEWTAAMLADIEATRARAIADGELDMTP